jgi:ABC-type sulfate/molybdate transport systems ATPase subunit
VTAFHIAVRADVGELHLDLEISGGARPVALIGPNGSGKTTLLRILCGAVKPDAGTIQVAGCTLFDAESKVDCPPEERRLAYVPQGFGIFPHLDVLNNVAFGLRFRRPQAARAELRDIARAMLRELACEHLAERTCSELSGGEKQKVSLARALLTDPVMLLLDEPLSALDAGARRQVRTFLVEQLRKCGLPALLVTHDVRDVGALNALVLVLEGGRIIQTGSLDELRAAPASEFVAEFVDTQ